MTLNEEIIASKIEKDLEEAATSLTEDLNFENKPISSYYSDTAIMLREFNYFSRISDRAKKNEITFTEAVELNLLVPDVSVENITTNKSKYYCALSILREKLDDTISNLNRNNSLDGYKFLAKAYTVLNK